MAADGPANLVLLWLTALVAGLVAFGAVAPARATPRNDTSKSRAPQANRRLLAEASTDAGTAAATAGKDAAAAQERAPADTARQGNAAAAKPRNDDAPEEAAAEPASAAEAARPPEAELRRARNEYAYGNYEQAIERLRGVLYPMRLTSDSAVIEARKTLALCYYLTNRKAAARAEFRKLLYLDPDYELDPYVVAPPIIELFEQTRSDLKTELDAIRQREADAKLERPTRQGYVRLVERTITERSGIATLLPFGAGQFQNGDVGWGIFFALSELVLVAANVGAYLWAWSLGDIQPNQDAKRTLARGLLVSQYASAGLFGVVWSVGVFHARMRFEPYTVGPQRVSEQPLEADDSGGQSSAAAPALGLQWQWRF